MKSDQKYYNSYPFPVRVLNDLANVYVLEPQDYCKVLNGEYTQSKLKLLPADGEREFLSNLDFDLSDVLKADLIPIAWAVGIDGADQKMTKAELVKAIEEKIGYGEEGDEDSELVDESGIVDEPEEGEETKDERDESAWD